MDLLIFCYCLHVFQVITWGQIVTDPTQSCSTSNYSGSNYYDPLINFSVSSIACSETQFVVLTDEGLLYSLPYVSECSSMVSGLCDEEWPAVSPQEVVLPLGSLATKVVSHADAKHFLVITEDGKVVSWGPSNDGGWLGVGDRDPHLNPLFVPGLSNVVQVAVGSTHSAAVTAKGRLYTWGRGSYGRLGHSDNLDQTQPKMVSALKDVIIVDVACGSGDAQTLAVTDRGHVYGWGDGDYGKLGLGGCNGTPSPMILYQLKNDRIFISRVFCGHQFSLALSKEGQVYAFGRTDNGRTGSGEDRPLRTPTLVQALAGYQIDKIAVGSCHVVCISTSGEVIVWGNNTRGQLGPVEPGSVRGTVWNPWEVTSMRQVPVQGVACGPNQTLFWTNGDTCTMSLRVAYVCNVTSETLSRLNDLLNRCGTSLLDVNTIPHQEQECLAVSALNLLRLQLITAVHNQVSPAELGIGVGSSLLMSLKQKVVNLATTPGVLNTIQKAAQAALQSGWVYLLPTPEERTSALSALLPCTGSDIRGVCGGRRFMLDLLVASLMADGGLEAAVDQGILFELKEAEKVKSAGIIDNETIDVSEDQEDSANSGLPLLHLLKQLLKNASSQTMMRLQVRISISILSFSFLVSVNFFLMIDDM